MEIILKSKLRFFLLALRRRNRQMQYMRSYLRSDQGCSRANGAQDQILMHSSSKRHDSKDMPGNPSPAYIVPGPKCIPSPHRHWSKVLCSLPMPHSILSPSKRIPSLARNPESNQGNYPPHPQAAPGNSRYPPAPGPTCSRTQRTWSSIRR
jgi:hypothetical protein